MNAEIIIKVLAFAPPLKFLNSISTQSSTAVFFRLPSFAVGASPRSQTILTVRVSSIATVHRNGY